MRDDHEHPFMFTVGNDALPATVRAIQAEMQKRGDPLPDPLGGTNTEAERFAYDVSGRLHRFSSVRGTIALTAAIIRTLRPSHLLATRGLRLVQHHLIVHRTMMLTARDTAYRLIAAVWDLGVPERALTNEKIITENRRLTPDLKAALTKLNAVVAPHAKERHDIVHAGGLANADEVDWYAIFERADALDDAAKKKYFARELRKGKRAVASSIDRDVVALDEAEADLFTALEPIYFRHITTLRASEVRHSAKAKWR